MRQPDQIEELISLIATLDRAALVEQIRQYRASFPIDFTPEFLECADLDRLRHIFVAICLQNDRLPEIAA